MNLLFVNCSMRAPGVSRTDRLARRFLQHYRGLHPELLWEEIALPRLGLLPLTGEAAQERDALLQAGELFYPLFDQAKLFARADRIVLAAPYWDLSFPALLKAYLEAICVCGITFHYEADGPHGDCLAQRLLYVTTAGGLIGPNNFGFSYVKGLCETLLGIPQALCLAAEGLDLDGADSEALLQSAFLQAEQLAARF